MGPVENGGASTFDRARRRSALRRLLRPLRGSASPDLLPLEEATRRLGPFARHHAGVRAIPLDSVLGTEGRGRDFDRDFLPRRRDVGPRWRRVERAFPEGDFPPIVVHQLGGAYFVIDGHHRVAIARQRGMETIDAEVTELRARWRLGPDAGPGELVHAEQERLFMAGSGLDRIRPGLALTVTRPVGYVELLETVQLHGYHAMLAAGRALERHEIARGWLDEVYEPTVTAIRREGSAWACRNATEADRFLHVWHRRRELVPEAGCLPLELAARRAASG